MTGEQLQAEVIKKLETAPDGIQQEVLDYLNDFERLSEEKQKRYVAFLKNCIEDRPLLLRLSRLIGLPVAAPPFHKFRSRKSCNPVPFGSSARDLSLIPSNTTSFFVHCELTVVNRQPPGQVSLRPIFSTPPSCPSTPIRNATSDRTLASSPKCSKPSVNLPWMRSWSARCRTASGAARPWASARR